MSLFDEIKADLMNESANVANTLRKALLLADEAASPELRAWALSELEGYQEPPFDDVPSYRRVYLPVYGTFLGVGSQREELITTSGLSDEIKDIADCLRVVDGVSALANNLTTGENIFQRTLPVEMTELLREHVRMPGMALVKTYQRVPCYVFESVLDSVKTKLLQFVWELQQQNVSPGDSTPEVVGAEPEVVGAEPEVVGAEPEVVGAEPEVVGADIVKGAFNITISGNNNIVNVGKKFTKKSARFPKET